MGKDTIVDVYKTKGKFCPVGYYKKWLQTSPPLGAWKPALRQQDGTPLTGRKFNKVLKNLLSPHLDYSKGKITMHSFRGGMATLRHIHICISK